ncbi:hypothetical protein MX551_003955 [Salmonella enterica]|nr:hypothetical protein [Salmonella enterica]EGY5277552.1 hypothetical protein [Salmonella enterica]EJC1133572.1 hypothetical protein [Salmonella enterica]EJC1458888.1 hypothetical protein [Salmonella enterica]EKP1945145.1 hypothetical protein [Salmonella enterica]
MADNKKDAFGVWCRHLLLRGSNPGARFMKRVVSITPTGSKGQASY